MVKKNVNERKLTEFLLELETFSATKLYELTKTRNDENVVELALGLERIIDKLKPIVENESKNIEIPSIVINELKSEIYQREQVEKKLRDLRKNLEEIVEFKTLELQSTNELLTKEIDDRKIMVKKLKHLNSTKDKFFSIIAHDLRSPFTSLISFSDYLVSNFDKCSLDEIKEITKSINSSANNEFKLLGNLLSWARMQTGQYEFLPQKFDISILINEINELFKTNATLKNVKINNCTNHEIIVFADRNMIHTVLRNLFSNAIKFSSDGDNITIKCREKNTNELELIFKDTGVGMSKEVSKHLFDLTKNKSTNGTNNEIGTGLGLIITKEFILKNNGKIIVESIPGEGSIFRITLPRKMNKKTNKLKVA